MSTRTRANRVRNPGAAGTHKPARYDRQVEHRKVRREAHELLSNVDEPDDLALPLEHHLREKVDPADRPAPEVRKQRFKVWKTRAWKRRSQQRTQRAQAWADLRKADDDDLEAVLD